MHCESVKKRKIKDSAPDTACNRRLWKSRPRRDSAASCLSSASSAALPGVVGLLAGLPPGAPGVAPAKPVRRCCGDGGCRGVKNGCEPGVAGALLAPACCSAKGVPFCCCCGGVASAPSGVW